MIGTTKPCINAPHVLMQIFFDTFIEMEIYMLCTYLCTVTFETAIKYKKSSDNIHMQSCVLYKCIASVAKLSHQGRRKVRKSGGAGSKVGA